eukprot:TRINITY_DN46691_c0_g1_i1.p1 TRINITY_DN46691_c0_g1~~TRINITY_DN46691_c0_g1_i1.p1  ORF type:complete len:293 (-),score=13.35 TRINITY_DN46691_c0_g1_i1:362-1240(-)
MGWSQHTLVGFLTLNNTRGIMSIHRCRGLGGNLAERGWNVYALDFSGAGLSPPWIDRTNGDHNTQTSRITEDLPSTLDFLLQKYDSVNIVAHSWGAVLFNAFLARHPEFIDKVNSCVYFGAKRRLQGRSVRKFITIDLFWKRLAYLLARPCGYLPMKRLARLHNESLGMHHGSATWMKSAKWVDVIDGFDYGEALKEHSLPPTLYFGLPSDLTADVRRFMLESHSQYFEGRPREIALLQNPKNTEVDVNGGKYKYMQLPSLYDHWSWLNACEAPHYALVDDWLATHNQQEEY